MPFIIPTVYKAIDQMTGVHQKIAASQNQMVTKFTANGYRAARSFDNIGKSADGLFNKVVNLKNALIGSALVVGAKKIFDETAAMASYADELVTTSRRINLTTQAFQELSFAAKLQNISEETLVKSFEKMNKNLGDLQRNGKAFKDIPASLRNSLKHAKNSEEAFNLISAAINKLPNQMQKAAMSQLFFGKSGQEMLNMIQEGPEAINKMREQAQKLGIVLSDDMIKNAQKFDDANDIMQVAIKGLKFNIAGQLMPTVIDYMNKITDWIAKNKELIKSKVAEAVDKVSNAVKFLIDNASTIVFWLKAFVIWMLFLKAVSISTTVILAGQAVVMGVYKTVMFLLNKQYRAATIAQWKLNAAMLANPVTIITIAIIALIALIIYLIVEFEGWGKTWDNLMKWCKLKWEMFKLAFVEGMLKLQDKFYNFTEAIASAWAWAQNKIGAISDEQYKKELARIDEEKRKRMVAMAEVAKAHNSLSKTADTMTIWEVKRKKDNNVMEKFAGGDLSSLMGGKDSNVKAINPRAELDQMMQQMGMNGKQGGDINLNIKTDSGAKAEVTKNTSKIPIKTTSSLQGAIKN